MQATVSKYRPIASVHTEEYGTVISTFTFENIECAFKPYKYNRKANQSFRPGTGGSKIHEEGGGTKL